VKLWESIKDLSDFEVDRNRRTDCTGERERISVNKSNGISDIFGRSQGLGFFCLEYCYTLKEFRCSPFYFFGYKMLSISTNTVSNV